ncbi:MAG: hypothetical protein AAF548_00755 [Actinomycetota bacterium]
MIWTDDVLFLHVPKTGGISITDHLLEHLNGSVSYTAEQPAKQAYGASFAHGRRHELMVEAQAFFQARGRSLEDFEEIFAVMRNPYDLEVSRYHYLQKGHEIDRGIAQDLAMEGDFTAYLEDAPFFGWSPPNIAGYYRIGERIPANLRILRFENLAAEINTRMNAHLDPDRGVLPHRNSSERDAYARYYDGRSEQLCYERHRWFFDLGFYPRLAIVGG